MLSLFLFFCLQTQSRMQLIADNYEEDHIHLQRHPHHLHHMYSTNLYHRSLPRGDPHANHRPPMDQVKTKWHTNTPWSSRWTLGLFTQVDMSWTFKFVPLRLMQFHMYQPHLHSVVIWFDSITFLVSLLFFVTLKPQYFLPS